MSLEAQYSIVRFIHFEALYGSLMGMRQIGIVMDTFIDIIDGTSLQSTF